MFQSFFIHLMTNKRVNYICMHLFYLYIAPCYNKRLARDRDITIGISNRHNILSSIKLNNF